MITGDKRTKIQLLDGLGEMRKQELESIPNVKQFKCEIEPEKNYHSSLLLFFPWRNEQELMGENGTYQESYISRQHAVIENAKNSIKTQKYWMWLWIHLMKVWSLSQLGLLLSPIKVRMKIWLDVLISLHCRRGQW